MKKGQISITVLVFSVVALILITGFVFLAGSFLRLSVREVNKSQAFAIAESGIEYYRWHLAHAPQDYWDGAPPGTPGPYTHSYYSGSGQLVGSFSLSITPPSARSAEIIVQSTGKVEADTSIAKIIEVKFSLSSLFQYNIVVNSNLQIGIGTQIYGPIMANGGIHFDGFANNLVQSALTTYKDSTTQGNNNQWAVHTTVSPADPQPPTPLPARPDVFVAGRRFPVPAADFAGIISVLANIKAQAQDGGVYASSSGAYGYDLVFSTSSTPFATTTYTLYKVTKLADPPNGCTNTSNVEGWGTWSIDTETQIASGTLPSNGMFFISDNLWVRGQINGGRVIVGSAVFPDSASTRTSITVNQDLRYTNYDGSDSIILVAQNNINIGLISNDNLRIDAALIAQNGRVGRFYYQPPNQQNNQQKCAPWANRIQFTTYGSIISNQQYQFGFEDGTGYQNRQILYDSSLYYNPPPILVNRGSYYIQTSWQEVQ